MVNGSIRSTAWARHKPLHEWERLLITKPYRILIVTIIRGRKNILRQRLFKKTQCRNQCFSAFRFCVASLRHIHGPFVSLQEWGNCHLVAVEDSFLPRPDLPAGYCFYGTRIDTAKWRTGPSDQATIGLESGGWF